MGLTVLPIEARDRLAGAELTYREAGATAGNLPAGYHQFTRSLPIGYGHELFVAAGDAVRQWQVQLGAGLQVSASSPAAVAGTVLLLGLGIGSLRLRAPCRVVYAVDEPRRRGFAYGTLAGHPESGEEAFIIEHHDDDSVRFRITAFSRPATRLAKIAGPLGAVVQRQVTAAYLRSLAKIAVQLARVTSGQSRLLPVARSGWSAASSATICPIPKLIVRVSIPCHVFHETAGHLSPKECGQPGQSPLHLGSIVEVEVPCGVQLPVPDRERVRWEVLAGRRPVRPGRDVQGVLTLQVRRAG
jgi:uncharacterized protein (UPF0548 family)